MKLKRGRIRKEILLVIVMFCFLLSGCEEGIREFRFDGYNYYLEEQREDGNMIFKNLNEDIIRIKKHEGRNKYDIIISNKKYIVSGNENRVDVQYPNGEKGFFQQSGLTGHGSGGVSGHPLPMEFREILQELNKKNEGFSVDVAKIFFGIILVIVGFFGIVFPEALWYLKYGWKVKNGEPSDAAIVMNRFGGILCCIIGVIVFVSSFF
ncbi:hypothetical protein RBH29_17220 [Herbivorax sp. ANBcel31]|uniref:DUF6199 family natural product biosynthesis protein n=1 Tax=Herbivorax sp. ANBcel31 TaxID=3069754 RepID=UPI0027B17417|nr:DUF6199 family natural product biosynthesis protein [Herbivorax sp. ANBcel31]MDQ2088166.1 hypothetical protein [Herbivorax sp. ANBcel31]